MKRGKKNNENIKDKKIRNRMKFLYRNFILFIAVTLIPLLILDKFYKNRFEQHINTSFKKSIEIRRNETIRQVQTLYKNLSFSLEAFSTTMATPYIINYSLNEDDKSLIESQELNFSERINIYKSQDYIKDIYVWDGEFNEIFSENHSDENILEELKKTAFQTPIYISDFKVDNYEGNQYIFYKITEEGHLVGYTAFKVSNSIFFSKDSNEQKKEINIYNDKFSVIYSNNPLNLYKDIINSMTKDMLDGFTQTIHFGNKIHSYSFIDLDNTTMYIDISEPQNIVLKPITDLKIFIIIIYIVSIGFSFILFLKFNKSLKEYNRECSLTEKEFFDSPMYNDFLDNLEGLMHITDGLIANENLIKNFKNKLDSMHMRVVDKGSEYNVENKIK